MEHRAMIATTRMLLVLFASLQSVNGVDTNVTVDGGSCFIDGNSTAAFYHNQNCEAALTDERTFINTVYTTPTASITATISGCLSTVCSLIILYLIGRSNIGLSSVYHRLVCGMSISDALVSAAIAFGTLPLPKDMIYKFDPGWVSGNQTTCAVQGFLVTTFFPIGLMFLSMLSIYYILTIIYKKRDAELKNNRAFTLYLPIIGTAYMLVGPVWGLFAGSFNPTTYLTWCHFIAYPYYCQEDGMEHNKCLHGGNSSMLKIWAEMEVLLLNFLFIAAIIAVISVLIAVFRQERYIKEMHKIVYRNGRLETDGERKLASTKKRQTYIKALSVQCAAYIFSYLICYLTSCVFSYLISFFSGAAIIGEIGEQGWGMQYFRVLAFPLQGFFNLLIFVGHKAYDKKVANQSLTTMQTIMNVFRENEEEKHFISNISLVRDDQAFDFDGDEQEIAMCDSEKEEDENRAECAMDGKNDDDLSDRTEINEVPLRSRGMEDSRLSLAEEEGSKISNYSELFGSWVSRDGTESRVGSLNLFGSLNSTDSAAVSATGVAFERAGEVSEE